MKKFLGAGYFDGFIDHLTHHQAIFPTSLCMFHFHSIVWIVAPTFLWCWALIILAFVIYFQQDDHPILLDVVAHVKTSIPLFQITLQNARTMLPQGVHSQVPHLKT